MGTTASMILAFILLAFVSHWAAFRIWNTHFDSLVTDHEIAKTKTASRAVEIMLANLAQRVSLAARMTASRNSLGRVLGKPLDSDGRATLRQSVDEMYAASGIDILEISNRDEILVYQAQAPSQADLPATGWGYYEALQGNATVASSNENNRIMLRAMEPIRSADRIVGVVGAGMQINDQTLQDIKQTVGAEISLISRRGKTHASTGERMSRVDAEVTEAAFKEKLPIYRRDTEAHKTRVYLPIVIVDDAYVVVVEIDGTAAAESQRAAKNAAVNTALATLLTSLLAGILFVRWRMRPLRELRLRAERITAEQGGDKTRPPSHDDIAAAVHALDDMTNRLLRRNEELVMAKQVAEQASQSKSQFLSNMSHEIRTPLNGVLGMAELLQRTPLNAQQSRFCDAILNAGKALHALLGDILDLAKIESGKIELENLDFDPGPLLSGLADLYKDLAAERGIAFENAIDPEALVPLNGDPTRLRQILTNLLGNAIKFTERGQIRLVVQSSAGQGDDPRHWITFQVIDSGCGIAPEALAQLFQPFVQADASTTRRFGGTGLGLVITRHFVELMGGTIQVESSPGSGSTFAVTLPFAPAADDFRPASAAPAVFDKVTARVLVAEDNLVNQTVIEAMLDEIGATAVIVENGAEALRMTRLEHFDIILMDCQMPELDGYQTTEAIRAEEGGKRHIPIIALTANALPEDRRRAMEAGMNDYLGKPVRIEALATMLLRWTKKEEPMNRDLSRKGDTDSDELAYTRLPTIDRQVMIDAELFCGSSSPKLRHRVTRAYLDETPRLLDTIKTAYAAGDWPQLTRAAHSLKSSSKTVGAMALGAISELLEAHARNEQAPAAANLLDPLEAQVGLVLRELDAAEKDLASQVLP